MSYSLVKTASWYTISKILVMALSFVSIPIFTHILTPNDYGLFALFTVWIGLLGPFIGLGLNLSVPRAKVEFKNSYYDYVSSILSLVIILYILATISLIAFRGTLVELTGIPNKFFFLLLFQVLLSLFISIGLSLLQFEFKYRAVSILSFVRGLLALIISVLLVLYVYEDYKLDGRIIGVFIVDLLLGGSLAVYILLKGQTFIDFKYWWFGIRYSVPFIFGSLSYILNSQFDRIVINEYIGSAETGIYSFSYTVGMLMLLVAVAVKQALNPWVYEKLDNLERKEVSNVYQIYLQMFTVVTVLFMFISPELIYILSDESFWGGKDILPWIIISAYIQILILNESETQMFLKKTGINSLIIVFGAIVNIVLNYIFIPVYGVIGAAVTTFATYLIMFLMLYYVNAFYFKFTLVKGREYTASLLYVILFTFIFYLLKDSLTLRLLAFLVNLFIFLKLIGKLTNKKRENLLSE